MRCSLSGNLAIKQNKTHKLTDFLKSFFRKITVIATMKKAKGNDVIINSFCAAVSTSISGLAFPKSIRATVANKIKTDQIKRCFLLGFFFPLSVNMLSTNTAESTEVTKKLIKRKIVVKFSNVANG